MNNEEIKPKVNNKKIMAFPLIFLILIIISTIGIYAYNYTLELQNIKLDKEISDLDKDIVTMNKNKNIQVYNIITKNSKILNKLETYSDITNFIESLAYIEKEYGLRLKGLSYSDGVISTNAITSFRITQTPYLLVSNFIDKYRKDKKVNFMLPFISKVTGTNKIKFSLKLKVKDSIIKK